MSSADCRGGLQGWYGVVPPYASFVASPPLIPKLYWDVYSQEERIKKICCEIEKLAQYSNLLSETVNKIESDVAESIKENQTLVDKKLKELEEELKNLINQVVGTSADYDVTVGAAVPTMQAHRNLYHWVTVHGMTVEEFNGAKPDMTVQELADSGLNCQGWAAMSRTAFGRDGIGNVPNEYLYHGGNK